MTELKPLPCPFCGCEFEQFERNRSGQFTWMHPDAGEDCILFTIRLTNDNPERLEKWNKRVLDEDVTLFLKYRSVEISDAMGTQYVDDVGSTVEQLLWALSEKYDVSAEDAWAVREIKSDDADARRFEVTLPNGTPWVVHALSAEDALSDARTNWDG